MGKLVETAKNIKSRVSKEAEHAPVSFIAAVATLIDLGVRLVGGHDSGLPTSTDLPVSSGQKLTSPAPLILLEFLGFQVAVAFIADWLNERAAGFGVSPGVVVGLFTAVFAAYLTAVDSFQLAYFLIDNERRGLDSFDGAIITSLAVVVVLMIIFLCERYYKRVGGLDLAILVMFRIGPFALVFLAALTYFVPQFEARLEPLNDAKINQRNSGH